MSLSADHGDHWGLLPPTGPRPCRPARPAPREPAVREEPRRTAIDRRRAVERAEREWGGRRSWGPWRVSRNLDGWAGEVVAGTGLASVPLHPATVGQWATVLLDPPTGRTGGLAVVAGALAAAALRDAALIAPEPGAVRVAYTVRDPDNESPVALGWGFRPAEARSLVVLAGTAYPVDELAGSGSPTGAEAVAGLVHRLAASFGVGCRPTTHGGRAWTPPAIGPTAWTGRPAPPVMMSVVVPAPGADAAPVAAAAPAPAPAPTGEPLRRRWWPRRSG